MPEVIETVVYTVDELSDAAKEIARAWYRQCALHDQWYDFVYEDFSEICRILGITLATTSMKLVGGATRDFPQIFFRASGARATAPPSPATTATHGAPPQAFAAMHPRTTNCTPSRTASTPSSGATSSSSAAKSVNAATTATNTPCTSRSSATAPPART